jgi:4-amino-4-deoxy-L-arabinose transferase-like glycosyltransferase
MARTAIFDSLLSLFVVLAVMAFYLAVEAEGEGPWWTVGNWTIAAWAAMALGVLTKGPVALAVPLLVAAPYAAWRRRSLRVWHPAGPLVLLLLVVPWLAVVEHRLPGFLRYALLTETWQRLTTPALRRTGPVWYFLPYLVAGCFPWLLLVAASARTAWRRPADRRAVAYLALWVVVPLLFFSFSQSKRPQYILPLVPAVALLAAWAWERAPAGLRAQRVAGAGWLLAGTVFAAAGLLAKRHLHGAPALVESARWTALVLSAVMAAAGIATWLASARATAAIVTLSLPLVTLPWLTGPLLVEIARSRSGKELAAAVRPHLAPDVEVVALDTFSPSLTFYLGRRVELCSPEGRALGSNYVVQHYDALARSPRSPLHDAGWCRAALLSCAPPRIFLLERHREAERRQLSAAGLPVSYAGGKVMAFGPCRPLEGSP